MRTSSAVKQKESGDRQQADRSRPASSAAVDQPTGLVSTAAPDLLARRALGNRLTRRAGVVQRACRQCEEEAEEPTVRRKCRECDEEDERSRAAGAGAGAGAGVQARLEVGPVDDPFEREADRVAERVIGMSGPPLSTAAPSSSLSVPSVAPTVRRQPEELEPQELEPDEVLRRKARESAPTTASPQFEARFGALGGGAALNPELRAFFEPRFGRDFGAVRLHTGARAAAVAESIRARAFTFGRDVVFGNGEFSPDSPRGRRLIAHELTHVVQQGTAVRRQPDDGPTSGEDENGRGAVASIEFAVEITRRMSADEYLVEAVRQYRRLSLEEARQAATGYRWVSEPRAITAEDVRRGYRTIRIRDASLTLQPATQAERAGRSRVFRRLPRGQQDSINAEADRRFWQGTNYRPGERLGTSPADRAMARTWLRYRDQVTREHQALAALPDGIREAIFDQYATETLDPADYPQLLRIAHRLEQLTPVQLADYRSRISGVTADLDAVEASVDRYHAMQEERREQAADYRQIETRLYRLQNLYRLYKRVKGTESAAGLPSVDSYGIRDSTVIQARSELPGLRGQLRSALARNGFASVAAFEAAIRQYIRQFAVQARNTALDMLAQLDHELFVQQRRYQASDAAEQLHQRIQASRASEEHARAWSLRRRASRIGARTTRGNWREVQAEQRPLMRQAAAAESTSNEEFQAAIGPDALAGQLDYRRKVRLLEAREAGTVRSTLLGYIAEKREAIQNTYANLADDEDLVFKLDNVLAATYQALEIAPGLIYDQIIRDHMSDVSISEAIWGVARGLFALFLAVVGGIVGGPVGAGAALIAFGIGVDEAVTQFREWEIGSEAHEAGLLSEEPSFAWVILAVVGAGLDFAGAVAAVRAMRPAVQAFNAGGDVAQLDAALGRLARLGQIDDSLRANVVSAARAERQFAGAVESLLATGGRLNMAIVPGAEELARLTVIAYYAARRGILRFHRFLLELQAQRIIASIDDLTPEQLRVLRDAFNEGVRRSATGFIDPSTLSRTARAVYSVDEIDQVAAHGHALGLSDDQIRGFLDQGSLARPKKVPPRGPMTPEEMRRQMSNWAGEVRPRGFPYLFDDLASFHRFRDELHSLLRQYQVPEGRVVVQGSSLRTPTAADVDIAIVVPDEVFDAYADTARAGIRARASRRAVPGLIETLDGHVANGMIPQYFIDRPGGLESFARTAYARLRSAFELPGLDISLMRASSTRLHPPTLEL